MIHKMKKNEPYTNTYQETPMELQNKAKMLIWNYNRTSSKQMNERKEILSELLGTYNDNVIIEPDFHCDYGFNIHFQGFAFINYNCTILDTSPVHIGNGVFVAPGVVIACSGHAIHPNERIKGLGTSAPITIEDNVWIGANSTICPGVTIHSGSVIGAGSVVNKDIPSNVIAAGVPCRVIREITDEDKIAR